MAPKVWALPRFWVSIQTYKRQLAKKIWGRILGLAWLKFAVAALKQSMLVFKYICTDSKTWKNRRRSKSTFEKTQVHNSRE